MAVYCKQIVDGTAQDVLTIEPHSSVQTDAELLAVKARSAANGGWSVEWTSTTSFSAYKVRWQNNDVVREFWTD